MTTLPPVTLCRNLSMGGTIFGPTRMKALLPAIFCTICPSLLSSVTMSPPSLPGTRPLTYAF
jgi:hypothetical protein